MYILYLDESGIESEHRYFVLAGLAIHESDTHSLSKTLDNLQLQYFPDSTIPIDFHASKLHSRKPPYDDWSYKRRRMLLDAVYQVIAQSRATLFAIALEKESTSPTFYEDAFEQIVSKFDRMLQRRNQESKEHQRGLVVIANSKYQTNITDRARRVWSDGHRWGKLQAIADIPYFAPAANTRLLQLADFAANAVFRRYERGVIQHFDPIAQRFDGGDGDMYGLVHKARERWNCFCPACYLWRLKNPHGSSDESNPLTVEEELLYTYKPDSAADLASQEL